MVTQIVNAVPPSQESITKDGERANGLGEVHAHEAADAGTLDFQNIVVRADGEVVARKGDSEVRKVVTFGAVNCVLAVE